MAFPCAIPLNLSNYSVTPQGRGWGAPCNVKLGRVQLREAAVSVDVRLAELVSLIMLANERDGYLYRKADTGAYNCRKIAGTSSWSWHSWAQAIDGNWQTNPYTSPLKTDMPEWVIRRWNRFGFAWGGHYSGKKDAMHKEFMGTPAQAVQLLEIARRELGGVVPLPQPIPVQPPSPPAPGKLVYSEQAKTDQRNLTETGFPCTIDGLWGPHSAQMCSLFQQAAAITVDGKPGPQTRAKLRLVPVWRGHPVSPGGYSDARWQQELKNHGWHITVDGKWGPRSTSILSQFQNERKLVRRDGVRDSQAWTALFTVPN